MVVNLDDNDLRSTRGLTRLLFSLYTLGIFLLAWGA